MRSVCVFCGSNPGTRPEYRASAEATGELLARSGVRLVFGGGAIGLMGAVAAAAMRAGGEVVGVIPAALDRREIANRAVTELHIVDTMHERKAMMAELSDGFIAFPGGLGTYEELFEVWTWAQLGIHAKPIGLLNVAGFYDPLLTFLASAAGEGFLRPEHLDLLVAETDPTSLIERMRDHRPPAVEKWLELPEA